VVKKRHRAVSQGAAIWKAQHIPLYMSIYKGHATQDRGLEARFFNTLLRLKNDFMIHQVHHLQLRLERFLLAEDIHQQKASVRLGFDDVHRFQDKIFLAVGKQISIRFTHRAAPL
jgi:hypothetical protein